MRIKFWGVRGSIPSPSVGDVFKTDYYGGNTACVEITTASGEEYILDAGTGMRLLGMDLIRRYKGNPIKAKILFSHVHWDHIQGWPFFVPAFVRGNHFRLYGEKKVNHSLQEVLKGQQQYPNFPVSLEYMGADIEFIDLEEGCSSSEDIEVGYIRLNHPDGVFSYRIAEQGKVFVYASDTEHDGHKFNRLFGPTDKKLIDWATNADVLVYDGQYTLEEYDKKKTWGHSTPQKGVEIALNAGVKTLVIFHHDPAHDDEFLKRMHVDAIAYRDQISKGDHDLSIVFAREGMEIQL